MSGLGLRLGNRLGRSGVLRRGEAWVGQTLSGGDGCPCANVPVPASHPDLELKPEWPHPEDTGTTSLSAASEGGRARGRGMHVGSKVSPTWTGRWARRAQPPRSLDVFVLPPQLAGALRVHVDPWWLKCHQVPGTT